METIVVEHSQYEAVVRRVIKESTGTTLVKTAGRLRTLVHNGKVLGSGGISDVTVEGLVEQDRYSATNLQEHVERMQRGPMGRKRGHIIGQDRNPYYNTDWVDEPIGPIHIQQL